MNILIVRLGALGDIVHAIPAAAALRRAYPAARIDWLVEARHRDAVDLVTAIDRVITLEGSTMAAWTAAIKVLRLTPYDLAIDFQGLMKSAILARGSGAARVVGFSLWHLREKGARPFYSDAHDAEGGHVIRKNLRLLEAIGIEAAGIDFPLAIPPSAAAEEVRRGAGAAARIALINPGAGWPNKRWRVERFAEVAAFLRGAVGFVPVVVWGPGEEAMARAIGEGSDGAAIVAPPTRVADLFALCREAALMVSGDSGPLHIATAVGTPVISIFGPTDPLRNGPWSVADESVSRYDICACHYDRRCHQARWCLDDLPAREVCAAVQRRLATAAVRG